jgi:predicted DNA-binding transcriptional regulator AlpA
MCNQHVHGFDQELIDPKECKTIYGFSTSRQAVLRSEGKLPFYRIGRYIRYSKAEINAWIQQHKVV